MTTWRGLGRARARSCAPNCTANEVGVARTGLCVLAFLLFAPAAQGQPAALQGSGDPLAFDTVVQLPQGPRIFAELSPGNPAISIRVSAKLAPFPAAAGRVLLSHQLRRARPFAERAGAVIGGDLQDGRIAFWVSGPLSKAAEAASLARRLLGPPELDDLGADFRAVRSRREQLAELPAGRMRLLLEMLGEPSLSAKTLNPSAGARDEGPPGEEASVPGREAAVGPKESIQSSPRLVLELWERALARDRLRVLVLGDLPLVWTIPELHRIGAPLAAGPFGPMSVERGRVAEAGPGSMSAWLGRALDMGPAGEPQTGPLERAIARALEERGAGEAELRILSSRSGERAWLGVLARARTEAAASREVEQAIEQAFEPLGRESRWRAAVQEEKATLWARLSTPLGWLALQDRYAETGGLRAHMLALDELSGRDPEEYFGRAAARIVALRLDP